LDHRTKEIRHAVKSGPLSEDVDLFGPELEERSEIRNHQ
jgi:hypothetical protein